MSSCNVTRAILKYCNMDKCDSRSRVIFTGCQHMQPRRFWPDFIAAGNKNNGDFENTRKNNGMFEYWVRSGTLLKVL